MPYIDKHKTFYKKGLSDGYKGGETMRVKVRLV